jgi:hypothetical protein
VKMGIKNFVFPTSWENLPPLLTAVSWQQAWSRKWNVTLLAANNGNGKAKSGSGIWDRGEPLKSYFNFSSTTDKLLVASVGSSTGSHNTAAAAAVVQVGRRNSTKRSLLAPLCGFLHCKVFKAEAGLTDVFKLQRDNLTCVLNVSVASSGAAGGEYYALAAHTGLLWFGEFLNTQFCALVHCSGGPLCLLPDPLLEKVYSSQTVFTDVTLTTTIGQAEEAFFPLMTVNDGQVAAPDQLAVEQTGGGQVYIMKAAGNLISLVSWFLPWK